MTTESPLPATALAPFAAYLLEHLDEVAAVNLAVSQELKLPLLQLFKDLPADELLAMYRESTRVFLDDLANGRVLETARIGLEQWERDEVPGLPRDAVQPGDLVVGYAAQRRAIVRQLPGYTTDPQEILAVVGALDELYTSVQNEALAVFDRLRREAAARAARAEGEQERLDREVARRTEELQAANEELAAQAEELTAQAEELSGQQEELLEAHRLIADQVRFQHQVLDNIPGSIGYCDLNMVIRAVNAPYAALLGKRIEDVVDRPVAEIFPPEALPELEALRDQIVATAAPVRHIGTPAGAGPDGRERFFDHVITPVYGRDGAIAGMLSLSTDATERMALERETARQKRLLERVTGRAPAGIAFLDRELVVRWANDELLRLFGREAESFIDRPLLEKASPTAREQFGSLLRRVLSTGDPYQAAALPYTLMREGRQVETYWDISYVPVPDDDGRAEGVLVFALDVSDRVANERSQHDRIDQMSQLDRVKDDFLAALSAQLATPVNAVVGLASVLEEGAVGGQLKPEQQDYLRRIMAMCHVQLALVNDLLDLGRFSADKLALEREPLDIVRVCEGVVATLRPLIQQQGQRLITYAPEGVTHVKADGTRIEQVFTNFLYAACKLTPPGGQIRLEVRVEGDQLLCEVQDGGQPLTDAQIAQALERFAQLGGTWLGLSVSRRLIEALGGKLGVTARPGTGNAYWFSLPL